MGRHGLGKFEAAVLLAVHKLHGTGYAVSIQEDLDKRADQLVSLGAIYVTLDRLEKKGLVSSRLGDPTPERGGRQKRFYRIEARGAQALTQAHLDNARMWNGWLSSSKPGLMGCA